MFVVGLTGGIGSGKSTVSDLFAGLGVPVIDTDLIARQLTVPGGDALKAIRDTFPDAVMRADGTLDRTALRRIVFSDAAARKQLEAILHPRIRLEVEHRLSQLHAAPYAMIVIPLLVQRQDHPQGAGRGCPRKGEAMTVKLLKQQHSCTKADKSATTTHHPDGEQPKGHKHLAAYPLRAEMHDYHDLLNRVLVVDCTEAQQIERVMARSTLSREEVLAIVATQAGRAQRRAAADDVMLNTAAPDALRADVAALHQRYLDRAVAHLP